MHKYAMRMGQHTRGTLHFWREATPRHEIEFAEGKLQTPGNVDRHLRRFPFEKRVPSGQSLRALLVLGTSHRPKLPFTAISISCPDPRSRTFAPAPHSRRLTDLGQVDEAVTWMVFGPIPPFGELRAGIVEREQRLHQAQRLACSSCL